jgi:hypothetical protein
MYELESLSDEQLPNATKRCAEEERSITVRLLKHIEEVDRRKLYLAKGYPTLYEFVRGWLNMSEGAAYRRISGMKLLRNVPAVERQIATGQMPLTTAARIQSAFKGRSPEERAEVAELCLGKSTREVDRTIAEAQPEELKEYTRWLSGDQVRLTIHLDKETFLSLNALKAIRSHSPGARTYGGVIESLIELGHREWSRLERSATSAPKSHCKNKSRAIPSATSTQVWQRDGGTCTYTDPSTGKRCGSTHFLQMDHIHPQALGGGNEAENLRLLCGQHNRWRAEQTFGPGPGGH